MNKYEIVIRKNTFYFFNPKFEEKYEGYITSLKETLLNLKQKIDENGIKRTFFIELIKKENGLEAFLALNAFSLENLKRLITIIRITNNEELAKLTFKEKWNDDKKGDLKEWSTNQILKLLKTNDYFVKGVVNLFFEGASVKFLAETLPLFELKKLSLNKLNFKIDELLDTIIRYKVKGSYAGKKENNPESYIEEILNELNISFKKGDLPILKEKENLSKRTMDFIIPNKENPQIIIECSYLSTTASNQGDKAKTEIEIQKLIKKHYPNAKFLGFVDGIGWYVRKNDLQRMVEAYEDVFTFHKDEIKRFKKELLKVFDGSK